MGAFSTNTVSRTNYVGYGGLFYVEASPRDGEVDISAIGLPVIDGVTACPDVVDRYRNCTPHRAPEGSSFASDVRRQSDIDVRGQKEAEVLSGLIAQLQRKRWQEAFRSATPKARPKNESIDEAFAPAEDE